MKNVPKEEKNGHWNFDLRQAAEEELKRSPNRVPERKEKNTEEDLIHELKVFQIELEMQNEKLQRTQSELEASRKKVFDFFDLSPVGYLTLDEKWLIVEANLTAATLLGVDKGTLERQPFTRFILPEDQDHYYRYRKQILEIRSNSRHGDARQTCELRIKKKDGISFWTRIELIVARDTGGNPIYRVAMSDLTEGKQAEETLLESEKSFRKMKEQLLNLGMVLTHDIRGPLISIVSILNLLLRGIYGKLDQNLIGIVQELLSRCLRLFGTTEDYLGQVSILNGSMNMERAELDLRQDIIDTVLDELADDIARHEIKIDTRLGTIPAGSIGISADKTWIKAVYRDLFSNAIKHGGKGCTISFGFEPHESQYRLNVYNSGRPIPESDRGKLFTRFEETKTEKKSAQDIGGLGLSLCREIILKHEGEIWYEALPDGSNFVFTIAKEKEKSLEHHGNNKQQRGGQSPNTSS